MVECRENNLNSSCKIYCDADPNTNCRYIEVYSANCYCKDAALLCMGNNCLINSSKIYCGCNQNTIYSEFQSWTDDIISVGSVSCNNNYTQETCKNIITEPQPYYDTLSHSPDSKKLYESLHN